jgi:hypothetical protein
VPQTGPQFCLNWGRNEKSGLKQFTGTNTIEKTLYYIIELSVKCSNWGYLATVFVQTGGELKSQDEKKQTGTKQTCNQSSFFTYNWSSLEFHSSPVLDLPFTCTRLD